jgi:hypothetical protein
MKKKHISLTICSLALTILFQSYSVSAQSGDNMINRAEKLENDDYRESQQDTVVQRTAGSDTTTIRIGNRTIMVIEKDGRTNVSILEKETATQRNASRPRPFKGNWKGLEIGLNNYLNRDFSVSLDPGEDFMEIHAARSWNVNLNMLQYDFALSGNNIGLVTGLGLEMNNYRFSNNVSITKQDRMIVPVDYDVLDINADKSRLRTYYLTVPLLLEFQTKDSRRSHRAHFSTGVIGGVNIGSNTRVVYRDRSRKNRDKVRDDFYLSPFRYGLTVRAGYRSLNLFANYYPTSLFQTNKGPELNPVSVGFSILGF